MNPNQKPVGQTSNFPQTTTVNQPGVGYPVGVKPGVVNIGKSQGVAPGSYPTTGGICPSPSGTYNSQGAQQGVQGVKGTQGVQAYQGVQGYQGAQGYQGVQQGAQQGYQGVQQGYQGVQQGVQQGYQGGQGVQGGYQGTQSYQTKTSTGSVGSTGSSGPLNQGINKNVLPGGNTVVQPTNGQGGTQAGSNTTGTKPYIQPGLYD
jgi:hypothetical protein